MCVQLTDDNHCDNAQIVTTRVFQKLFQSFLYAGWLCGCKTHLIELFLTERHKIGVTR